MKVIAFQMHESMFLAGVGEIKKNVTKQFYPGLEASMSDSGTYLICTFKQIKFLVPVVACKNIVVENDQLS